MATYCERMSYSESFHVHGSLLQAWTLVNQPPETPKQRLVRLFFQSNNVVLTPTQIRLLAGNWDLFCTAPGALLKMFDN